MNPLDAALASIDTLYTAATLDRDAGFPRHRRWRQQVADRVAEGLPVDAAMRAAEREVFGPVKASHAGRSA